MKKIKRKKPGYSDLMALHIRSRELYGMIESARLQGPDSERRMQKSYLKAELKFERALSRAVGA